MTCPLALPLLSRWPPAPWLRLGRAFRSPRRHSVIHRHARDLLGISRRLAALQRGQLHKPRRGQSIAAFRLFCDRRGIGGIPVLIIIAIAAVAGRARLIVSFTPLGAWIRASGIQRERGPRGRRPNECNQDIRARRFRFHGGASGDHDHRLAGLDLASDRRKGASALVSNRRRQSLGGHSLQRGTRYGRRRGARRFGYRRDQ